MGCLAIIIICAMLGYTTLYLQEEDLSLILDKSYLKSILISIFGSLFRFSSFVRFSFYFASVIHLLEAVYVLYQCQTVLKLKLSCSMKWFLMVVCVGYPSTKLVLNLVSIQKK